MEQKMVDHLFEGVDASETDTVNQRADDLRALASAGVMPTDEEPKVWSDEHPELTDREMALGQALGQDIDIDDDEDNGDVT